jgi:hypothetical protein
MKAHELLTPEGAWTKGSDARDKDGKEVQVSDLRAKSFCLVGAVLRCYVEESSESTRAYDGQCARIYDTLWAAPYFARNGIMGWNDAPERTQAEVVALLKELDI